MTKHETKDNIGYWLCRSARKLDKFFEAYLSDLNMTSNEFAILNSINCSESTTPSELVEFLNMDKGYITRQIVSLEKKGFVARKKSKTDRRSFFLELTAKGLAILPEMIECSHETNRQVKALLTVKEQKDLLKILMKIGNSDI